MLRRTVHLVVLFILLQCTLVSAAGSGDATPLGTALRLCISEDTSPSASKTRAYGVAHSTSAPILVLTPSEDGQVHLAIDSNELSVSQVADQWWPAVGMIPSPPQEMQVIIEFDLGSLSEERVGQATLRYFIGGGNDAYAVVRLETWSYPGNGVVDVSDFNAGVHFHGLFEWDSPIPEFPSPPVNEWVEYDVAAALHDAGQFIAFNLRLAGDFPQYDGDVFNPDNPFRFLGVASSENGGDGGALLTCPRFMYQPL